MDIKKFLDILTSNLQVDEKLILDSLPSLANREDCEAAYTALIDELAETEHHLKSFGQVSNNPLIKEASADSVRKLEHNRNVIKDVYSATFSAAENNPKYANLCYSLLHDYLVNE